MKEKPICDTSDCEKEDIVYLPYFGVIGDPNNEYMRDVKASLAAWHAKYDTRTGKKKAED